jgi:putative restriction endonuclease
MKKGQRLWTRNELTLAINLYCKLPFGKLHNTNPEIIDLAKLINRTPSSVAYKLVNFASLDPSLKARGIVGASNTSKLDKEIWNEYYENWDTLPYESEKQLAILLGSTVEKMNHIAEDELPIDKTTREQTIKSRVNQRFFRRKILAAYNNTCCITGISQPELLIAGHIRPWGIDEKNRLNPSNGIAINALHDKAFEAGLLTITPNYTIKISNQILKKNDSVLFDYLGKFENKKNFSSLPLST